MTHALPHLHLAAPFGAGVRGIAWQGLAGLSRSRRPVVVPAMARAAIHPCERAFAAI